MSSDTKTRSHRPGVLIVDDIPAFLEESASTLESSGVRSRVCDDPTRALEMIQRYRPRVLVTTLVMRAMGGFDVIRKVRGAGHRLPVVMITGHGTPASEREAARLGCSDYLNKPVAAAELVARVRRAIRLAEQGLDDAVRIGPMVTRDPAMRAVMDMVDTVADSNCRVLILGETGTGKQLVAQNIHGRGRRPKSPFVEVNCSAIPENLLESELFGHRRGAFTDAVKDRTGRFAAAGDGTIFLDEIGEMPLTLQAKLLHVLDDGKFTPVGGERAQRNKARVIAATNRDLGREVERGRFRSDLYYRLNVVAVRLPPLRDRPGDIPLLFDYFAERFTEGGATVTASDGALAVLQGYAWPGNIRELQNTVERLAVLQPGRVIEPSDLPARFFNQPDGLNEQDEAARLGGPWRSAKRRFEAAYVKRMIDREGGNLAAAARAAELDRAQFYRMAQRHGLLPTADRGGR
ncbi:MAG: sigma-54 dependent transcriptional regulator [Planctomycetota bacterium]